MNAGTTPGTATLNDELLQGFGAVNATFSGDADSIVHANVAGQTLTIGDDIAGGSADFATTGFVTVDLGATLTLRDNLATLGDLTLVDGTLNVNDAGVGDGQINLSSDDNLEGGTLANPGVVNAVEVNLFSGAVRGNLTINGLLDGSQGPNGNVNPAEALPGVGVTTANDGFVLEDGDNLRIHIDGIGINDRIVAAGNAGVVDVTDADLILPLSLIHI